MKEAIEREIEYLRVGHLTYYIMKIVEGMPKVDMHPYYALIFQELENKNRLGPERAFFIPGLNFLARMVF